MFRKVLIALGAIALIAAVNYLQPVGRADDDVEKAPSKKPQLVQAPMLGPEEQIGQEEKLPEKVDIDKIEKTPPAILDVDPTLEKPKLPAQKPIGGPAATTRAIPMALLWLAHHQSADGSWSMHDYTEQCKDKTCTGQSDISSDAGATALGLLPFLGAGETQRSKGPYQEQIRKGIDWLIRNQQPDGNLAKGSRQLMYGHGLASIVLSEAYGMTSDARVGEAAQKAVNFIVAAQNRKDGGWRYNPGDPATPAFWAGS